MPSYSQACTSQHNSILRIRLWPSLSTVGLPSRTSLNIKIKLKEKDGFTFELKGLKQQSSESAFLCLFLGFFNQWQLVLQLHGHAAQKQMASWSILKFNLANKRLKSMWYMIRCTWLARFWVFLTSGAVGSVWLSIVGLWVTENPCGVLRV